MPAATSRSQDRRSEHPKTCTTSVRPRLSRLELRARTTTSGYSNGNELEPCLPSRLPSYKSSTEKRSPWLGSTGKVNRQLVESHEHHFRKRLHSLRVLALPISENSSPDSNTNDRPSRVTGCDIRRAARPIHEKDRYGSSPVLFAPRGPLTLSLTALVFNYPLGTKLVRLSRQRLRGRKCYMKRVSLHVANAPNTTHDQCDTATPSPQQRRAAGPCYPKFRSKSRRRDAKHTCCRHHLPPVPAKLRGRSSLQTLQSPISKASDSRIRTRGE